MAIEVKFAASAAEKPIAIGTYLYAQTGRGHRADEAFTSHLVVGDTGQSWLVSTEPGRKPALTGRTRKINKKTMLEANGYQAGMPMRWYTQPAMMDKRYTEANRFKIARMVEHCEADQLRAIAAIVGFVEHKK